MAKVDVLKSVIKLTNSSFRDSRGQLFTIWEEKALPNMSFNHDKVAISKKMFYEDYILINLGN